MRQAESFVSYDIYNSSETPLKIIEVLDNNSNIINKSNSENRMYFQLNGNPSDICKEIIDKTNLSIQDLSYYCTFTTLEDKTFLRIIK